MLRSTRHRLSAALTVLSLLAGATALAFGTARRRGADASGAGRPWTAGANTIKLYNDTEAAPDLDRVSLG